MYSAIRILKSGFHTSVQDGGRHGYAYLGVPESGAMDQRAYYLANALLNNSPNEALLECTLVGPHIEFLNDMYFAITGASANALLNGETILEGVPVFARAGHILTLSKLKHGIRSYIAFAGGLKTEIVLGSRSWYKPVTTYEKLGKGFEISVGSSNFCKQKGAHLRFVRNELAEVQTLRAFQGPEYGQLSSLEKEKLHINPFTVSNLWNRMAVQLEEPFRNKLSPIKTSPVIPGTVQLTPSGKLMLLVRDCQTTGGYPRILQLRQESINTLAQMQNGRKLLFSIT